MDDRYRVRQRRRSVVDIPSALQDYAETLARRWALSPSQLAVVVDSLDEYLRLPTYRTSDEAERVERWRSLMMQIRSRVR